MSWFVLLPADLSERPGERGGDDYAPEIAAVLGVVLIVSVLVAMRARPPAASSIAAGGAVSWAAFFAYFAGTSEVSGANLWMVPFVFAVIPCAVVVWAGVGQLEKWLATRSRRRAP